jgi:hypothetical protein
VVADGVSLGTLRPLFDSVANLDGVCDLEEHLDEGVEFIFSIGISSLLTRGLESRDLGVPDCERCFEPSRDFEVEGVLIGALDGFDELRFLDDDSMLNILMLIQVQNLICDGKLTFRPC